MLTRLFGSKRGATCDSAGFAIGFSVSCSGGSAAVVLAGLPGLGATFGVGAGFGSGFGVAVGFG
ncbi:MAG: hypothetical protein EDR02_18725, partial [Actinobacteria bacterium]